jgi:hypothetical protein
MHLFSWNKALADDQITESTKDFNPKVKDLNPFSFSQEKRKTPKDTDF